MYTYYNPTKTLAQLMKSTETKSVHHNIPMNVTLKDDVYQIEAFLPNIKAEDIEIEILENRISIRGEYPKTEEDENITYLLKEQPSGTFSRTLRMPKDLDANLAEAKVENSVLKLSIPQAEYAKAKLIDIKTK